MKNPVLLIHGIWDTSRQMKLLKRDLERVGREVVAMDLIPNDGSVSIRDLAQQVKKVVDDKKWKTFDLLGFSMGGIVAKCYLTEYGGSERVNTFVTISSPHHGTMTGRAYPFVAGKELSPGSALIEDLEAKMKTVSGVRCLSLRTPFDFMIVPSQSSIVTWAENADYPVWMHQWMLTDKKVREHVVDFLERRTLWGIIRGIIQLMVWAVVALLGAVFLATLLAALQHLVNFS